MALGFLTGLGWLVMYKLQKQIKEIITPDMSVFIGSGFDCEQGVLDCGPRGDQSFILWYVCDAHGHRCIEKGRSFRPRLNKEQVLDDYSFIGSLEGFVWELMALYPSSGGELRVHEHFTSVDILDFDNDIQFIDFEQEGCLVQWVSFKGVRQGSVYEAWARQNDIPVINVDGEVVL